MSRRARRPGSPDRSPRPASAHALLQLMWLASPELPVGGFSHSEVPEAAVESGGVTGEAQAAAWLRDQLQLALARSEPPVVAKARSRPGRAATSHCGRWPRLHVAIYRVWRRNARGQHFV